VAEQHYDELRAHGVAYINSDGNAAVISELKARTHSKNSATILRTRFPTRNKTKQRGSASNFGNSNAKTPSSAKNS